LLFLAVSAGACTNPGPNPIDGGRSDSPVDAVEVDADGGPAEGAAGAVPSNAVIWRGLGFAWQKTPHRLNKMGAFVEGGPSDEPSTIAVRSRATFEGGSWSTGQRGSDIADYEVGYTALRTDAARFVEGTFEGLLVKGDAKSNPEVIAQASRTERISLDEAGVADAGEVALVLRGFYIDTDVTHTDGYTTRGFTVRLHNTARQGADLVTTLSARVHAGTVLDRIQNLEDYGAIVTVGYTIVAVDRGSIANDSVAYALDLAGGVNPTHPPADASLATRILTGAADHAGGVVAFTGVELWLNEGATTFPGRYLRAVRVMNEKLSYDPVKGVMSCWTDGYFSNSGLVTHVTKVAFRADLLLLQLDDPAVKIVHDSFSGASTTPTTSNQREHELH
jgi:hypothetical protein